MGEGSSVGNDEEEERGRLGREAKDGGGRDKDKEGEMMEVGKDGG